VALAPHWAWKSENAQELKWAIVLSSLNWGILPFVGSTAQGFILANELNCDLFGGIDVVKKAIALDSAVKC
jgi:hypothetical protein